MSVPEADELVRDPRSVLVDRTLAPDARLRDAPFDPTDGFDVDEIALLAITHSPDLAAARADVRMAEAQAVSAGLPPDPQLALGVDRVMGQAPGTTLAYSAGLTFDLSALLSLNANRAIADAELQRARLDLHWQAWQVVAKARLLFVKIESTSRLQALLAADKEALRTRLETARSAVQRRLISTDQAAPLQAAYDDASRQAIDVERQRNQALHDLDAMVGVAPEVELPLVGDVESSMLTEDEVRVALARTPHERPDLLALRMALEVQDDKYRAALRAQFPAITIGPTRARDTSNVNTWGLAIGITLPLFNRNRGGIAIESATRDKLLADFEQRLDADRIESHRLLAEAAILRRQADELERSVLTARAIAGQARLAYARSAIDAFALTAAESALLARETERIDNHVALQEQAIALQALLGDASGSTPLIDKPRT